MMIENSHIAETRPFAGPIIRQSELAMGRNGGPFYPLRTLAHCSSKRLMETEIAVFNS